MVVYISQVKMRRGQHVILIIVYQANNRVATWLPETITIPSQKPTPSSSEDSTNKHVAKHVLLRVFRAEQTNSHAKGVPAT